MKPTLQPMDIVVIDGQWFMPHHWLIRWRGLDAGVHCFTIMNSSGDGISPEFAGMKVRNIDHYAGRRVTIHRYRWNFDHWHLVRWVMDLYNRTQRKTGVKYDFKQWLFGFVFGLTCRRWVDDSDAYTCAELPNDAFSENGYPLTQTPEVLPMPRMFRYSNEFITVFDGIWQ